jgi:hypothetical protein
MLQPQSWVGKSEQKHFEGIRRTRTRALFTNVDQVHHGRKQVFKAILGLVRSIQLLVDETQIVHSSKSK